MNHDRVQQTYDDFDDSWIPRVLYERRARECEALQAQIDQLREELTTLERRLKMWEVEAT